MDRHQTYQDSRWDFLICCQSGQSIVYALEEYEPNDLIKILFCRAYCFDTINQMLCSIFKQKGCKQRKTWYSFFLFAIRDAQPVRKNRPKPMLFRSILQSLAGIYSSTSGRVRSVEFQFRKCPLDPTDPSAASKFY